MKPDRALDDLAEGLADLLIVRARQEVARERLTNNGDKVVGAFVGDPHARETHWSGERLAR